MSISSIKPYKAIAVMIGVFVFLMVLLMLEIALVMEGWNVILGAISFNITYSQAFILLLLGDLLLICIFTAFHQWNQRI